jgi:uncharacterized RDD family membrane protein YckC
VASSISLRNVVDLVLLVAYAGSTVLVIATWPEPEWSSLSRTDQQRLLIERNPVHGLYQVAQQLWGWSELIVLLLNEKRRALHDFIAGTVVIRTV